MIFLLFTYLITYSPTPSNTVLLEKLASSQLVKNFLTFYWPRMFISAFTSARQISLTWVISIQDMPLYPTSWKSILKKFSHLSLGLPSGTFSLFSPRKPCIQLCSQPTDYMPPLACYLTPPRTKYSPNHY